MAFAAWHSFILVSTMYIARYARGFYHILQRVFCFIPTKKQTKKDRFYKTVFFIDNDTKN